MEKLINGIKENLVSFILVAASVVFGLVGMIAFFISSGIPGYGLSSLAAFFVVVVLLATAASAFCVAWFGADNKISAILSLVVIVLALVTFGIVLNARILTVAAVMSYDAGNPVAISAIKSAVVAIVGLLVAAIVTVVSGFLAKKK